MESRFKGKCYCLVRDADKHKTLVDITCHTMKHINGIRHVGGFLSERDARDVLALHLSLKLFGNVNRDFMLSIVSTGFVSLAEDDYYVAIRDIASLAHTDKDMIVLRQSGPCNAYEDWKIGECVVEYAITHLEDIATPFNLFGNSILP